MARRREFGTDPYGIIAAGVPGGDSSGRGIGGSGFSVGSVGTPMPDVSRAPGNSVGTGRGVIFSTSFGGNPGGGSGTIDKHAFTAGAVKKKAKGGKVKKMAKGGSTASKRGDGCATKGKTKGRFV